MYNTLRHPLFWFTLALVLQGAHMIEHFAQLFQYQILRLPIYEAHGILFFLDLEWNHFIFNLLYLLMLAFAFMQTKIYDAREFPGPAWARYAFILGFAIQFYHVIEHSTRIGQTLQTGCEPCPGILGWYLNGIYLHFTLNTITWVLPMIPYFAAGFHKKVFARA